MTVKRATGITNDVRRKVYERDYGMCIFCGAPAVDIMHYISRGRLGLGIEQNLGCGCRLCHMRYDQSGDRVAFRERFKAYLDIHYPDFKDEWRIYRK